MLEYFAIKFFKRSNANMTNLTVNFVDPFVMTNPTVLSFYSMQCVFTS